MEMGKAYKTAGRRWAAGLSCLVLLLSILAPASANRGKTTVRVGYVQSTNFSEGESDDAYKSGYAYEYLQKIACYTGWEYEYVYGDWATVFEMLCQGQVDMMAGVSRTEERSRMMDFPDYPMGTENYYIYVWQDSALASREDGVLKGLTIGCIENSTMSLFLEAWNRKGGNHCVIQTFSGNDLLYQAFSDQELDAVVDTDNAILPSDGLVPLVQVGASDYYLAVAKNRAPLLEQLNDVLEEIDRTSPYYLQSLHSKYFSETAVVMTLTQPEKAWLAAHDSIRVGYMEQYMPYCGSGEGGLPTGVMVDVFSQMLEKLSLKEQIQVEYTPFDDQREMLEAVNEGTVDVIFPVYGDIWFSERQGIFQTTNVADVMVDLVFKGDYRNLSVSRVGVNRNNLLQEQDSIRRYPGAEIVYFDNINECLEAIVKGQIDCTLTNGLRTNALISRDIYASLNTLELSDFFPLSMGVKRGQTGLLTLLNHGLSTLDKNYVLNNAYKYQNSIYVYTAKDFLLENTTGVIGAILLAAAGIIYFFLRDSRRAKTYLAQEKALTRSLEDALEDAQRANRAKTIFLNNMSHDIRTPMNAIIGFTDIARKQNTNAAVGNCLEKIASSSEHLLSLINDVLDISRVESGKAVCTPVPTNLRSVVETVLAIAQGFLAGRRLDFQVERPQEPCGVLADPVRIREVLVNLLGNAVKFTDDGGTVIFSMDQRPGADERHIIVRFTVADTGRGMSAEFLPHVFDEFSQEESGARTQYKGTGLGMAITKKYVDMMGGTIRVESRKDVGTTFTVELPLERAEVPAERPQQQPQIKLEGVRVLMAEDNDLNAEIVAIQLGEAGMIVTRAVNGREVVERFTQSPPGSFDVILMDIMMPQMDGYEATRTIRAMENRPDSKTIPIIAMTANAFAEDVAASLAAGMNAHLSKPLVMAEVITTITRNLPQ